MLPVVIIAAAVCVSMIMLVLFKPSVRIGRSVVNIYWAAPLLGAIVMAAVGFATPSSIASGLLADSEVNPIKILLLFLSMTLISVFLDNTGFFGYLAMLALRRSGKSRLTLLVSLYLAVSILTIFTSNDIIVLTFTPFICYFAKSADIDPIPFLVGEFVAANTWSMALIIGNPTNIYLSGSTNVTFAEYIRIMALPTAMAGIASALVIFLLFRRSLSAPIVKKDYPEVKLDKPLMFLGIAHLFVSILLMTVSSYIDFPMWLASLVCFLSLYFWAFVYLFVKRRPITPITASLKRTPYEIIPFVLSMFIIVLALKECGFTALITDFLSRFNALISYGVSSLLAANLVNNIPMSVLFSSIIEPTQGLVRTQALFASVVGSNLGAFLTPIGALAGIMWTGMLKDHGLKFTFSQFIRCCAPCAVAALAAALLGLYIIL